MFARNIDWGFFEDIFYKITFDAEIVHLPYDPGDLNYTSK